MAHDINELRKHLFATIEALNDKDKPMDIERAHAVAEIAQTIINSAKVEVQYAAASGAKVSNFIGLDAPKNGVTTHRLGN
ncbi:hypothetical protein SFMTTN_2061 [Sulfuriferula multivorans]|uniref:Phage protein n=1 Tax=Sulfuriferula multivorans TaxID=1559896 RepID=A0A401JF69_9PROT|nr:hypothetical protein [Sulfuriferula multivorans]GBL46248.1 hypothetical protein SFMTTN_2061 [Sulfuriferula multivorans]